MSQDLANQLMSFLPLVAIVVLMLVMTVIPQRRRDKKAKEMMASMKKGDLVKTIGGVHGRIVRVKKDVVTIETGPQHVELTFSKAAIATVGDSDFEAAGLSDSEIDTAVGKEKK